MTLRPRWVAAEVEAVRTHYSTAPWAILCTEVPKRSRKQIQQKANQLGLVRAKEPKMSDEERLRRKARSMAKRRLADPDGVRAYGRAYHNANRARVQQRTRALHRRRFFWSRATKFVHITARDLASLWKRQRGLCALTGRKLDRTAQLDHIVPRARGGGDEITNLRWLCHEANLAKRALSDSEFLDLCSAVMRWIGERIQLVDALP